MLHVLLTQRCLHVKTQLFVSDQIVSVLIDLIECTDHILNLYPRSDQRLSDLLASQRPLLWVLVLKNLPQWLTSVVIEIVAVSFVFDWSEGGRS